MKQTVSVLCILSLIVVAACGNESQGTDSALEQQAGNETAGAVMPEVDHWLVVTDSIGVELGDSNFVFGQIVGAQFMPDGDIVVADMMKSKISIFSPEGEFVASAGRQGSGPGEYQLVSTVAVTAEGGLIVPDAMGGKLNFYDSDYNFVDAMTGFFPSPPVMISSVTGGFVGLKPEFEQTEEDMRTGMGIYLWTDSATADLEYIKNMIPFDLNDLGATVKTMVLFDADCNGNVFLAPYSTEDYTITCVSPDGEELWNITEEQAAVKKTDEEIEEEKELVRSRLIASGAPAAMAENYQVEEYKAFISMLEVDNLHRLWVQSGLYDSAFYRVYNCDNGDFLFTAALRADDEHEGVTPTICEYGVTGFDPNTDTWSRLYIIHPEEPDLFQTQDW
ncbi:MAG: 6-bladed beta-propeller [Candidatus Fermentibacteraceae bacterium]|nr:6-bladed beta-propeller [Candidatus Fermentibacteraceae bacterium]